MRLPQRTRAASAAACLFVIFAGSPILAGEGQYHVIAKGETIYSLARAFGIDASAIQLANGITDPAKLRVGQRILIPGIHRVAKGETLYGIAKDLGTTVDELRRLNKLAASAVLHVGDVLVVPSSASSVAATAGTTGSQSGTVPAPPDVKAVKADGSSDHVAVAKPIRGNADLPCAGEARYLDGKVFGIAIRGVEGASVRSVTSGTVVSAGPYRGFGSVVFVQTRSGLIYVYGGNKELDVKVGDLVRKGQLVGKVGSDTFTGMTDAYFFVFKGSTALDPAIASRE